MIRVPFTIKALIRGNPIYNFGGHHGPLDRTKITLRQQKSGYYLNPNQTTRRIMRVISQHQRIQNPESFSLNTQWHQTGLNELDLVELFIGIEDEFDVEFPDEISQKFKDINDVVEYVSRSFWAQ